MPLPGWNRLRGTAERYRTPTGKVVSRRQYDNARAKRSGFSSYSHYMRVRKDREYVQGETDVILGQGKTVRQVRRIDSPYNRAYAAMVADEGPNRSLSPDGPLAQWLVLIGRREPEDTHDVGETDEIKSGGA